VVSLSLPFDRPRRIARHVLPAVALMTALVAPPALSGPGPGQTRAEYLARVRAHKARAVELMSQGASQRASAAVRHAAAVREARRRGLPAPGARQRSAPTNEDGARPSYEVAVTARRFATHATVTAPPNVPANRRDGDAAGTTQSEEAIAAWRDYVLVAWNDGKGPQFQGYAFSTDGGRTFTDGGAPPAPAGWVWWSDPTLTVDERTGTFYFGALVDPSDATNGVAVVAATVTGGRLAWGNPVLVRSAGYARAVFDKPCLVADSTSGNLYLTYTTFGPGAGDQIEFQRSTNGGETWSAPVALSSPRDHGRVQGARAAVGPAGELYAAWMAIGTGPEDYLRVRRSDDRGVTWGRETTAAAYYSNFGTGAPGFNRERGTDLPSIAVDRTNGANRGRVHLAWTETINRYDDALNTLGTVVESEHNDRPALADRFAPGQRLRGTLAPAGDVDYYSFAAVQGTNLLFECDSIPATLYTLRVFCGQDTLTRLAFAGDLDAPAGGGGYIVWTVPSTGTYYLRIASAEGGSPGGYRISTGTAGAGVERSRDARDVFATHSDDGAGWAAPVRVCDAPARYGEFLPEIAVAPDGMPYVTWFDWRDDGCGGRSYQYLSRSGDGGITWAAGQRFSDEPTDWTSLSLNSNLAPDMGDYSGLCAGARFLHAAWADGRRGDPDVHTARIDTRFDFTACQGDLAVAPGTSVNPSWTVRNRNPLFANTYGWTLAGPRNWPLVAAGAAVADPDGTVAIRPAFTVPDSAAPGVQRMCLTVTDARGAASRSCCFDVRVEPAPRDVPVLASAFDLRATTPDPATRQTRIDFSLPNSGPVRVRIHGIRGEVVRTLADGVRPAGPSSVLWDGRDERGDRAGAGAYICRLEGSGNVRVQRLIWLK